MSTFTSNKDARTRPVDLPVPPSEDAAWLGLSLSVWIKISIITLLFATLFWPNLRRLWDKTNPFTGEDNWRHGFFVPLVGLYYLFVNREELLSARVETAWSGLFITLVGLFTFACAIFPLQNDWFKDLGMVITLFGVVTMLCGWRVMKTAWFPIVFLICALPWPGLFYSWLAGPLQNQAARVAVRMLNLCGVDSAQAGTKIFIAGEHNVVRTLNVAEACSGLKSLMTFVAIAGAVAFVSVRPIWQKIVIMLSAIPIAIFCNTMRVTAQGLIDHYFSHQWSEGVAHGFIGWVMMMPAFFVLLLVGWIVQNIFIEEVTDKSALRSTYTPAARRPVAAGASAVAAARVAAAPRRFDPLPRAGAAGNTPAVNPTAAKPNVGQPKPPGGASAGSSSSRPEGKP